MKAFAEGLDCEKQSILDITSLIIRGEEVPKIDEDLILIGMPVYEEKIPDVARDYFLNLNGADKPVVLIAVYGNIGFGLSLIELKEISKQVNLQVVAAAAFIGEHSFSTTDNPIAKNRPDKLDLQKAREFGERVKEILRGIPSGEYVVEPEISGHLPLMARILPKNSAPRFTYAPIVDRDLCNDCGICVKSCPMAAIDPDDLSINEDKCLRCFSCVKKCKKKARKIKYKKKTLVTNVLRLRGRKRKEPTIFI